MIWAEYASEILEIRQGFSRKCFKEETGWKALRRWDLQKYGAMTWAVFIWLQVGFYDMYDMIINSRGSFNMWDTSGINERQ
jgi:hypothetical protein